MKSSSLFQTIPWMDTCFQLFELLPNVSFWVKDRDSRFLRVNDNFLDLTGLGKKEYIHGKSDYDIWPAHLAEGYVKDDFEVIHSGKSIINRIELIRERNGETKWFCTSKIPQFDKTKKIVGIVGFSVDLKGTDENFKPVIKLKPAIDYIMTNYSENIEIGKLSKMMGLSLSAFERQFKKQFNETPIRYINQIRLEAACELMMNSSKTISEIAIKTGFYDSSHFTRQFIKSKKETPRNFRKRLFSLKDNISPK